MLNVHMPRQRNNVVMRVVYSILILVIAAGVLSRVLRRTVTAQLKTLNIDVSEASVSGDIVIGYGKTVKPAYGPLKLQYKSGLDSYADALTIRDTTGTIQANGLLESLSGGFKYSDGTTQTTAGMTSSDTVRSTRRQDNTTNTSGQTNQYVLKGWGYSQGTSNPSAADTVTYGITFTDIPIVVAQYNSNKQSTAPTSLSQCYVSNAYYAGVTASPRNISTTAMVITLGYFNPFIGATEFPCYSWVAIGTYSGADLAENYLTYDMSLKPGDVVAIDEKNDIAVRKSADTYDKNIFGIVSTAPGQILSDQYATSADGSTKASKEAVGKNRKLIVENKAMVVPVALEGRVPVKVSLENGGIQRGDYLTASSKPGIAMKATKSGQIIGRALEDFDGTQSILDSSDEEYRYIQKQLKEGKNIDMNKINFDEPRQTGIGKIMVTVEQGFFQGQGKDSLPYLQTKTTQLLYLVTALLGGVSLISITMAWTALKRTTRKHG